MIDDASYWDGNATINEMRTRLMLAFGWHAGPSPQQVQQVLNSLIADDLVVKDGARHDGAHYALTFRGKQKLARLRQREAQVA